MLGRRSLRRPAVASQTESLPRSPRFELRRMRNTNSGKAASIAIPATRFAAYFIQPATDLIFKLDPFGGIFSKDFEFPADDTTKSKDVPLRLSDLHRKTPYGAHRPPLIRTIRLQVN